MIGNRIYPSVVEALINEEDLSFDDYFIDIVESILTDSMVKDLCEERYNVLTESFLSDAKPDRQYYDMVVTRFLTSDRRTRASLKTLILCYAAKGVIPVTQAKLGICVEEFLSRAGKWTTSRKIYKDAMKHRLPGSFEGGKRR